MNTLADLLHDAEPVVIFLTIASSYTLGRIHQWKRACRTERQRIADIRDGIIQRRALHIHRSN